MHILIKKPYYEPAWKVLPTTSNSIPHSVWEIIIYQATEQDKRNL